MSIVQKLTEGIINRDLSKDGAALINKWEKTGLLEGLDDDHVRNGMACLLENQAKELLREASSMAAGDVEGFAAVAFPLVRRVFGNLIANDLVSVQPMSLPSGLIFFLDFVVSDTIGANNPIRDRLGYPAGKSLFGGNKVAHQITGGVQIDGANLFANRGPYGLNNAYSSPTGSFTADNGATATGLVHGMAGDSTSEAWRIARFDADFVSASTAIAVVRLDLGTAGGFDQLNLADFSAIQVSSAQQPEATCGGGLGIASSSAGDDMMGGQLIRRLTQWSGSTSESPHSPRTSSGTVLLTFIGTGSNGGINGQASSQLLDDMVLAMNNANTTVSYPQTDDFTTGNGNPGSVVGTTVWGLENEGNIPEIDIKIDSVAITAVTKKLKAKWTPELGQDLNAYHNLDAEVELTQILSEQIALEIDREILEDLVQGSTAAVRYWSRAPGRFLDRETGREAEGLAAGPPDFTGNVSEWYETLVETCNDVSAQIHRKTLRGGANFIVVSPEVANILEFTAGFRANVTVDSDRGTAGAVKVGNLSKKWDIYVDPYFLRNVILVGRRGGSFLESGYVYAPYVPLQTTPTIFGVEDFVPRKGVMTRYAKKMVRPDMYGLVIIADMELG